MQLVWQFTKFYINFIKKNQWKRCISVYLTKNRKRKRKKPNYMNSFKFQTPKGENGAQTTYTFPKLENKLENTLRRMEMHFSFEIGLYEYRPKKIWKCISRFNVIFKCTCLGREMRNNIFPSWIMQVYFFVILTQWRIQLWYFNNKKSFGWGGGGRERFMRV